MEEKMRKYFTLILMLLLVFALLAGCAPKTTDAPGQTTTKAADTTTAAPGTTTEKAGDTTEPADVDEDPVDIVLLVPDHNPPEYPLNMDRPNMQKIHDVLLEKFNVNWSIESVMGERYDELLNTRLAADTD